MEPAPSSRVTGTVTAVTQRRNGTVLTAAAGIGDQVLTVEDNVDHASGRQARITSPDDPDAGVVVDIAGVDGTTLVTLAAPLAAAWPEETLLLVEPPTGETVAMVRVDDATEAVPCTIAHALADALPPGIRDDVTGEIVALERIGGSLTVVEVVDRPTSRDIQTAEQGERIVIRHDDDGGGVIEAWSGLDGEEPGVVNPTAFSGRPAIRMQPGTTPTNSERSELLLYSGTAAEGSVAALAAALLSLSAHRPSGGGSGSSELFLQADDDIFLSADRVEIATHVEIHSYLEVVEIRARTSIANYITLGSTSHPIDAPGSLKSGVRNISFAGANPVDSNVDIVFGTQFHATNAKVPVVVVTPQNTNPDAFAFSVSNVSRTGFKLRVTRLTGSSSDIDVGWIAFAEPA